MNPAPKLTQAEIAAKEKDFAEQGWTRQFTTFPDRIAEYLELYEELGFDVRIEPWALTANGDPSCDECSLTGMMHTIFIRKK